jgi:hypothetical protein
MGDEARLRMAPEPSLSAMFMLATGVRLFTPDLLRIILWCALAYPFSEASFARQFWLSFLFSVD